MATFETEMRRAQIMQTAEPDRADYWTGFQRGLRRAHHGESFGTQAEHELWLSLADDEMADRRMKGEGYRAGLEMNSGQRGQPPRFVKTTSVPVRIEDSDLDRVPRNHKGNPDQDWLRAAIREKLERDGL